MPKEPRIEIVVDSDGELLIYTDGHLSGSQALKKTVRRVSLLERPVQLVAPYGDPVVASLDNPEDPIAITAALVGANPGRSTILDAPDAVWDFLEDQEEAYGEDLRPGVVGDDDDDDDWELVDEDEDEE